VLEQPSADDFDRDRGMIDQFNRDVRTVGYDRRDQVRWQVAHELDRGRIMLLQHAALTVFGPVANYPPNA
jgi:hypothetical protein